MLRVLIETYRLFYKENSQGPNSLAVFGLGRHGAIGNQQGARIKRKKETKGMYYLIEFSCLKDISQNPFVLKSQRICYRFTKQQQCKQYCTDEKHIRNYSGTQETGEITTCERECRGWVSQQLSSVRWGRSFRGRSSKAAKRHRTVAISMKPERKGRIAVFLLF